MTIMEMASRAHDNAVKHGFWDDVEEMLLLNPGDSGTREQYINRVVGCCLMLITSELGEAIEAWRHGEKEEFAEELADAVIRIGDLAGFMQIDLEQAMVGKMNRNEKRPYKHGKEF